MSFIEDIKDIFGFSIKKTLKNLEGELISVANNAARRSVRYVKKELMNLFLMIFSLILFSFAAIFFLIEYLHLSKTISFLAVAFLILLIALISRTLI